MNNLSLDEMTEQYLDVLKELGNIGTGNAATALAQMIDCRVDMKVPQVRLLEFKDLGSILGGEEAVLVSVYLRIEGDIEGSMMFVLPEKSGLNLVNKLMSGMLGIPEKPIEECQFGEMECSAMKEVGNIITGAYLNAISSLTNMSFIPSVPQLSIDMAGAILSVPAAEFGEYGDYILLIQTQFSDEMDLNGYFILIPDVESYGKILSSLGVMQDE